MVTYPPQPGVAKIAVLRANGLGDLMFALPALGALRAAYPQAEITLLAKSWHAEFFAGISAPVDRVIGVPKCPGVGAPEDDGLSSAEQAELDDFLERMASEGFDLGIQMHGGGRYSNPFMRRVRPRLSIGLKTPEAVPLDRCCPYVYFQHEVARYLELVALAGATPAVCEPTLPVSDEDRAVVDGVLPWHERDRPLVVLHPGASDPRRRWPAASFAAVGDALAGAGARIIITGQGNEHDLVEQVIAAMSCPAIDLCDRLSLPALRGLLSRCRLVVANDTGPLHLAAAVGARTVGIYWCGNMINGGPIGRTRHRAEISWQLSCSDCGRNCLEGDCGHRPSFVSPVPVAAVLGSARELLTA